MLSPELIVSVLEKREAHEETGSLPPSRFDYGVQIHTISESVKYTLACLQDHTTPFVGGELVSRSYALKTRNGARVVKTAVWPVHWLDKDSDSNSGGSLQIELLIDAYGDIMARCITDLPDGSQRTSWARKFGEDTLRPKLAAEVLCGLESFRDRLDEQLFLPQPSLV